MDKQIKYTDNDRAIVSALKNAPEGLTIAEVNEATGLNIQPGSFTSAVRKGLIAVADEKREVIRMQKRPATLYRFVTADTLTTVDKKGNTVPANYTDNEKKVLAAAASFGDQEFMLCELAEAMGVEKLSSGAITGLVRKGNIAKNEEKVIREVPKPFPVNVYLFVADIPSAE